MVIAVQIVLFLVGLLFAKCLVEAPQWQQEVRFAIFMFASFGGAICAPLLEALLS